MGRCRAAQLASIRQISGQVSRGSAGGYQADEGAGVARLSWSFVPFHFIHYFICTLLGSFPVNVQPALLLKLAPAFLKNLSVYS